MKLASGTVPRLRMSAGIPPIPPRFLNGVHTDFIMSIIINLSHASTVNWRIESLLLLLLLLLLLVTAIEFSLGGSSPYTSNK